MASGPPATGTFKKRAPGILFFPLKQLWISILVRSAEWLIEFSRAYTPDKTDFRVYSIKRRGVYWFFLQKHMVSAWAFIKGWRFFSLSYLLNFVTQYYVKGADRKKVF